MHFFCYLCPTTHFCVPLVLVDEHYFACCTEAKHHSWANVVGLDFELLTSQSLGCSCLLIQGSYGSGVQIVQMLATLNSESPSSLSLDRNIACWSHMVFMVIHIIFKNLVRSDALLAERTKISRSLETKMLAPRCIPSSPALYCIAARHFVSDEIDLYLEARTKALANACLC